jgi:hypothetical protein
VLFAGQGCGRALLLTVALLVGVCVSNVAVAQEMSEAITFIDNRDDQKYRAVSRNKCSDVGHIKQFQHIGRQYCRANLSVFASSSFTLRGTRPSRRSDRSVGGGKVNLAMTIALVCKKFTKTLFFPARDYYITASALGTAPAPKTRTVNQKRRADDNSQTLRLFLYAL